MLLPISRLLMIAQEFAGVLRVRCHPGDGIEFVIAHDAPGGSRLNHASHEIHGRQLLRPAIDQIPDENRRPPGMPERSRVLTISQMLQQSDELLELTVHVPDHIKRHSSPRFSTWRGPGRHLYGNITSATVSR